ncbi:hypothetical protein [Polaromonas glacialis]|nr:hypothetical protein [Polaromonas glacialis]
MRRFQVVSNALAVAGDRLVAIISVEPAGSVTVTEQHQPEMDHAD